MMFDGTKVLIPSDQNILARVGLEGYTFLSEMVLKQCHIRSYKEILDMSSNKKVNPDQFHKPVTNMDRNLSRRALLATGLAAPYLCSPPHPRRPGQSGAQR